MEKDIESVKTSEKKNVIDISQNIKDNDGSIEVPHVNVIICTPGYSLLSTYVKSLLETLGELNKRNITWAFSSEYSSHVGDAREITLNGDNRNDITQQKPFKGNLTYDKLFWIDSDIRWTPDDFLKLYYSDKEIISGAYLLATGEVTAYPERLKPGYTYEQVMDLKELTEVQALGFGFICVKQGVFECLTRPWFQSHPVSWTDPDTGESHQFFMMGEDMSWCERVMDKGYKLWLDPQVRVIHHKTMQLTWEGPRP